jgi:hypothetical protein
MKILQLLTKIFLNFEHTDGLNYINTVFSWVDFISNLFKLSNTYKFQVNITEVFGTTLTNPKKNTQLLKKDR